MSNLTYAILCVAEDKLLVWLHGEVKTPPFSRDARIEAGFLLRSLQAGYSLSMPHSRPMPTTGPRCHEPRVIDKGKTWRIIYRVDSDAIVIAEVFSRTTRATPKQAIENSKSRLKNYDEVSRGKPTR
jgi:phage-related protein